MVNHPTAARTDRTAQVPAKVPVFRYGDAPDDARSVRETTPEPATEPAPEHREPVREVVPSQDEATRFINALDDNFLSCRGDRHDFPKLRLKAGRLPRGIRAPRQRDGSFQLVFTCRDCGTERIRTTLPGGRYDPNVAYTYHYPKGYLSPKDSGLRRGDFAAELHERIQQGGIFQ